MSCHSQFPKKEEQSTPIAIYVGILSPPLAPPPPPSRFLRTLNQVLLPAVSSLQAARPVLASAGLPFASLVHCAVQSTKPRCTSDMNTTLSSSLVPRNWTRLDNLKSGEESEEYIDSSHGSLQLWAVLTIALGTAGFIAYLLLGAVWMVKRNKRQHVAGIK